MIDGISDHVNKRLINLLDHVSIDLRLFSPHLEHGFLPRFLGQVPNEADHFLECALYGNHPHGHADALKLIGNTAKLDGILLEFLILDTMYFRTLEHHRLGNHQLSHHIHEVVQLASVDSDGSRVFLGMTLLPQCQGHILSTGSPFAHKLFAQFDPLGLTAGRRLFHDLGAYHLPLHKDLSDLLDRHTRAAPWLWYGKA